MINNGRISETTEGLLLFLSGLKASLLFFLPDTSSVHSSDRRTGRIVSRLPYLMTVATICCALVTNTTRCPRLPDVMSMLCRSSSSLLIFSSSSFWTVSKSNSFSLCTCKTTGYVTSAPLDPANEAMVIKACVFPTSQCWQAAWVSQSYLCLTDSRHSSL